MRKQIALLISLVMFCVAVICPIYAQGIVSVDTTKEASLTLYYQKDEQIFSNIQIGIYRVAKVLENGSFELIEPFSSYSINIYDIIAQEEWKNTAETINSFVVANQLMPYREGKTNEDGMVSFTNLETGLYFVNEVVTENNTGTYVFDQFMVYLPTPQLDGSFNYNVEAKPKCSDFVPKTEYKVTKLWKDSGYQNERPNQVEVDIYKNGELQETQVLNSENNWTYVWYVSENDHSKWTVSERTVAKNYNVEIMHNEGCYSIINMHKGETTASNSPQTGETNNLMYWIMITCIVGIVFIVVGTYNRRRTL